MTMDETYFKNKVWIWRMKRTLQVERIWKVVNVFFGFSMNSVLKPKEIFLAKPARIAERFLDQNFFL